MVGQGRRQGQRLCCSRQGQLVGSITQLFTLKYAASAWWRAQHHSVLVVRLCRLAKMATVGVLVDGLVACGLSRRVSSLEE